MSTTVKDEVMTAIACLQRSQNGYSSKNMEVDGLLTAYPSHDCEVGLAEVRGKRRLPGGMVVATMRIPGACCHVHPLAVQV